MKFEKGNKYSKGGGRPKGVPNKKTAQVKEAIELAFNQMGGVEALVAWGKKRPDIFYGQVWPKLLPMQVNSNVTINKIVVTIGDDNSAATPVE